MKYTVHYESKPGMWELYDGTKMVEANSGEETIDKAHKLIRKDFFDRPWNGQHFSVNQ